MMDNYDGIDIKSRQYKIITPNKTQSKHVGRKFKELTAITPVVIVNDDTVKNPTGFRSWWLFQCSCGNKVCKQFISVANNQKAPDCGCGRKKFYADKYIGKTYNYLTVISLDEDYKKINNIQSNAAYYKCQCKCGKYKTVRITALIAGEVKSCGCLKKEQEQKNLVHGINLIDLTNKQFGLLTVLERDKTIEDSKHDTRWKCQCKCGNIKIVRGSSLRNGETISCGCLKESYGEYKIKEILKENNISFIQNEAYFKDLITSRGGIGRYDFIILDENNLPTRLIEFDGLQHYKPIDIFGGEQRFKEQQENDKIKNEYARKINIPLIRIPYDKINQITLKTLFDNTFLMTEMF